jgi:cysteine-rich repeat protein
MIPLVNVPTGPAEGPYTLNVTLRQEVGEGVACDPKGEGDYCTPELLCRTEPESSVCRTIACGDGYVEGAEECDDGNEEAGDGCAACKLEARDSCAAPGVLTFRTEDGKQVARAASSTANATDAFDAPGCAGNTLDHVYSFTLTDERSVNVVLTPSAGFDASLALMIDSCSTDTAAQVTCVDDAAEGRAESYSGNLPQGTYYVVVDGPAALERGAYDLRVTASPVTAN